MTTIEPAQLQPARREVIDESVDKPAIQWTGEANGVGVKLVVTDPDLRLYVRPTIRAAGSLPVDGVIVETALVDETGKAHARAQQHA